MIRKILFLLVSSISCYVSAQTAIAGQLNLNNEIGATKIQLFKLDVDHLNDSKFSKPVALATIKKDGSFSFDKKYLSDKDAIYRICVKKMEKAIKDTIAGGVTFIMSNSDKVHFYTSEKPFVKYTTTNVADKEWKKLKAFETELLQSQLTQKGGQNKFEGYAKDSLRILLVKLISIKKLQEKGLLEQDVVKNSSYYLTILTELKDSKIPADNYRFFENELAFLTQDIIEEKYAWSKAINYVLGFVVLGLLGFLAFRRKKEPTFVPLSKQEQNIQNLIVKGKTNKEIANELFISISTVKTHITNIYAKLKVSNRQELVQRAQN